jgi:hypothetical protein
LIHRQQLSCLDSISAWSQKRIVARTVSAHVGGAAWRVPVLVSAAVPAVEVVGRVVAEAIVETLPVLRTASRTLG